MFRDFFSKTIYFLTSQVRCADMPPAGRKIHFFTFLTKNDQCSGVEWNGCILVILGPFNHFGIKFGSLT